MDADDRETRDLSVEERQVIAAAREKAFLLYEGKVIPHRSCGIALAQTFNLPTRPYQALRRGGVSGEHYCGSILAGELILGEYLGDPDPAGAVTAVLRHALGWYQAQVPQRIGRGASPDFVCRNLTDPHGEFTGPARRSFCTNLTAEVAELTAEALLRFGGADVRLEIEPIET